MDASILILHSNACSCEIACEGNCGNSSMNSISEEASNACNPGTIVSNEHTDNNHSIGLNNSCDKSCKIGDSLLSPTDSNCIGDAESKAVREIGEKPIHQETFRLLKDSAILTHNETSNNSTQTPPITHL